MSDSDIGRKKARIALKGNRAKKSLRMLRHSRLQKKCVSCPARGGKRAAKTKGYALFCDEVEDAPWDDNRLDDRLSVELFGDGGDGLCGFDDVVVGGVSVDFDGAARFADDLDGHFNAGDFAFLCVEFGPLCVGDAVGVAEDAPEFFGDVWGVGRQDEDEGFGGGFWNFFEAA